jgi:hypothetical protein
MNAEISGGNCTMSGLVLRNKKGYFSVSLYYTAHPVQK